MERSGTKEAAEALLRELPSVRGAYVREDVFGHPREIHILLSAGPAPRHFARDVRDLLEERLGIPVDQRVISIAQLAPAAASQPSAAGTAATPPAPAAERETDRPQATAAVADEQAPATRAATADVPPPVSTQPSPSASPVPESARADTESDLRMRFLGTETSRQGGRVSVVVRLGRGDGGSEYRGEDTQVDSAHARLRSGARALLDAANRACAQRGRFELEDAARIRALGRDYVLLTVVAHAPRIGRRPLTLAGAQPIEEEEESAAALAALKAVNRVLALILTDD